MLAYLLPMLYQLEMIGQAGVSRSLVRRQKFSPSPVCARWFKFDPVHGKKLSPDSRPVPSTIKLVSSSSARRESRTPVKQNEAMGMFTIT